MFTSQKTLRLRGQVLASLRTKTVITVLIDSLPGGRSRALLKSIGFFGVPAISLLSLFFWIRRDSITCESSTLIFVYIASMWIWLGPYLVWRYEQVILNRHWRLIKKVKQNRSQYLDYRRKYKGGLARNTRLSLALLLGWIALVVAAFLGSFQFMSGLGVQDPYKDIWWYVWILGVSLYAYITGLGLLGVSRTVLLSKDLLNIDVALRPYHPDGHGGLACLSSLLIETTVIFSSGSLFVPILLDLGQSLHNWGGLLALTLVLVYSVAIASSFFVPALFIYRKVTKEIAFRAEQLIDRIERIETGPEASSKQLMYSFNLRHDCRDLGTMVAWPIDVEKIITLFGTIALPVILFVFERWLSTAPSIAN